MLESKITGNTEAVILDTKIKTKAADADQKELYLLIREDGRWLIDELQVGDEILELTKEGI